MTSLKEYIARCDLARRKSSTTTRSRSHMREGVGEVSIMRSPSLDTASIALPGDVDLKIRAARMNEFWDKLVEFQHRDVIVVALCVGGEQ